LVTEGYLSIKIKNDQWAPKLIVLNTACKKSDIHNKDLKFGKKKMLDNEDFAFFHYNLIDSQIGFAIKRGFLDAD
jgi:hypothetical protein